MRLFLTIGQYRSLSIIEWIIHSSSSTLTHYLQIISLLFYKHPVSIRLHLLVGTLRVWYSLADRMCMLITSDLCTIYEAIKGVECYKLCGDTNTKSRDLHTTLLPDWSYTTISHSKIVSTNPESQV